METLWKLLWLMLPVLLLGTSCSGPSEKENDSGGSPSDSGVVLTIAQVKNAGITFGLIEKKLLSHDVHARGELVLPPEGMATVSMMTGGIVESIKVSTGDRVNKGMELASISSPEIIHLQQEYLLASHQCQLLEKDFLRQQELIRENISSGKKFQEAEADFDQAKATRESLRLRLKQLNIPPDALREGRFFESAPVVSPIDGTIEEVHINPGKFVEPNSVLFTVISRQHLLLELMTFEKDILYVKPGQRVTFHISSLGDSIFEARVNTVGQRVGEDARTVRVMASIKGMNPGILPGMFVAAEIHTDEQLLEALPEEAVAADQQGEYCFFTLGEGPGSLFRFYRLPLRTGFKEDKYIQVQPLFQLPEGARIVVKGTYYIRAAGLKARD